MPSKKVGVIAAMSLLLAAGVALAQNPDKPGEGKTVRPAAASMPTEQFQNGILYQALKDLGYNVADTLEVEYATAHVAVGNGDADFTPVHWAPMHDAFFEQSGGASKVTRLGPYFVGAVQGYLIDKKTYDSGITNLEQLADPSVASKFDWDGDGKADLAGCVPGWGCERIIEHELDAYKLRETVTHQQGDYVVMLADVIARFKEGKPILYTAWMPHWIHGVLVPGRDVEWLEVPFTSLPDGQMGDTMYEGKNLGFATNTNYIVANNAFLDDNPAVRKLFEVIKIQVQAINDENTKMENGEDNAKDIQRHVDEWIAAHQAEYDGWLTAAREAAK